ncbi:hypothetical protein BC829DRAFT_436082 [Chytridium lagenaria]|nr:hypothetical protein BC829DRAFT_436082 [Chytridium lagenaria]
MTPSTRRCPHLPAEILHAILTDHDIATLHACSLVNRSWSPIALHHLPKHFHPKTATSLKRFLSTPHHTAHNVKSIDLSAIRVILETADLDPFFRFPFTRLTHLDLRQTRNLTNAHLLHVAAAPLSSLKLAGHRTVTDLSLIPLFRNIGKTLKVLWVDACPGVTDDTFRAIAMYVEGLLELTASALKGVTGRGVEALAGSGVKYLETLKTVRIYEFPQISDAAFIQLFRQFRIEILELYRMPDMTDDVMLSVNTTHLRHLCLGEMSGISDTSLSTIFTGKIFPLTSLTICHSDTITDYALHILFTSCPTLTTLDITLLGGITIHSLHVASRSCQLRHLVVSGNLGPEGVTAGMLVDVVRGMRLWSLTVFQSWDLEWGHVGEMSGVVDKVYLKNCRLIEGKGRWMSGCEIYVNSF